jgi:multiple sugar transport system permease protein
MTATLNRVEAALPPQRQTRRVTSGQRKALLDGLLFSLPFLVVYAIFLLAPVAQAFYMSAYRWDLLGSTRKFIGLDNYVRMLWGTDMTWSAFALWPIRLLIVAAAAAIALRLYRQRPRVLPAALVIGAGVLIAALMGIRPSDEGSWNDPEFWVSLRNTVVFTVVSTPLLILLGLGMALTLHTRRRGVAGYRAVFFLPYVLPISAVTLIWSYLLNPDRGLIAGFLGWFGLDGIPFLSDPRLAMPAIIATTLWWSVGFNMVLFLAGLQDIEPSLYEAASLDGASAWQRFMNVTVPGLNHIIVLVTITQVIASFQIFGQVYIMTRGGPGNATQVLIQHIYESGFRNYQLGYAAALSVFLFLVMAAVSAIQFRLLSKEG